MHSGAVKMGFPGKVGTVLWVAGDLGAVGTIVASLAGLLPPLAALIAIVFYLIQIKESDTIARFLRNMRLRKLVKLRARAVEYELYLHNKNQDLNGLARANKVHLAAEIAASQSTQESLNKEVALKAVAASKVIHTVDKGA
jgi:hypothetical protein